jgi:alcohol dehydrogenase class IV
MAIIQYLTHVRFGRGELSQLPEDVASLGMSRPLVITDRGLVASGLMNRLCAAMPSVCSQVIFDATPSNPTEEAALAALDLYVGHRCDGLIAFGGGSPIDLAKAVALLATHVGPLGRYAAIDGGMQHVSAAVAPVIAVPTTSGTGAEVGRAALMTLTDGRKLAIISPHLIPKRAICDPSLTDALPPRLTAATGMDALSHCIETYLSPRYNPVADAIALDGAGRIARALPRAIENPNDTTARDELMMGALMGGLTFQKGLGAVHGLSHALGSLAEPSLHHGTLNAVLLPPVLRFNAEVAAERIARLKAAMNVPAATALDRFIEKLNAAMGLPASLKAMGVPASVIDEMADKAFRDHSTATNPRPVSREDYVAMLNEMIGA